MTTTATVAQITASTAAAKGMTTFMMSNAAAAYAFTSSPMSGSTLSAWRSVGPVRQAGAG